MEGTLAASGIPWKNRRESKTDAPAAQTTAGLSSADSQNWTARGAEEESIRRSRLSLVRKRAPTALARLDLSSWNRVDRR